MDSTGVFQLKDGTWGFRFRVTIGGKIVDRKRTKDDNGLPYKNMRDAVRARKVAIEQEEEKQAMLVRQQQMIDSALAKANPNRRTFAEVFNEYCEKGRGDRAFATKRKQDSIWENHLQAAFGDKFVDEITTAEIQDYLVSLYYDNGLAYRYVESFLKMFYLVFGQAYSRGYLDHDTYCRLTKNKDTKIHMPKLKIDEDLEIVAFTPDECKFLEEYFTGTNAETAYVLGRYCGLRINECYGLKWNQVDFENGVIKIEQQMQYLNGLICLVPLKTRNARRTIYMNARVKSHLQEMFAKREHDAVALAEVRRQNQRMITDVDGQLISSLELVNCLPNGHMQSVNSMKYPSRELKKKYGINFKFHFLRHTYGTQLAVLNTPTHLLCNQMGHGNIHVTERYYIAISETGIDALKRNIEML